MDNVHPLIRSFLERTTVEQWESFIQGRPDDATTILVAELILEIIAALYNSVVSTLASHTPTSEESVLTKLEENLSQTKQELWEFKMNSEKVASQRITPISRINAMIVQFVEIFKKFSDEIKTFIGPRPHKISECTLSSRDLLLDEDIKSPIAEGIRKEINDEFRDIFSPLMVDLPEDECKDLHREISEEIKIVAEEIRTFSETRSETLAVKPVVKKIKSFFARSFAKVCLMRIFAKLKKKHSKQAEAKSDSVETILEKLSSQFLDQEDHNTECEDALVQVFTDLCGNKVLDFNQELSNEIYHHSVPEDPSPTVEREDQSEVHADIRSKAWVFIGLMKWYLKTQVNWVIDRVTVPYVNRSGMNKLPAPVRSDENIARQEALRAKNRLYVKFVIEKVVFTVCSDAKMLPMTAYDLINNLVEIVWERVKEEQFYTDSEVFENLEKNIKKLLYKVLGSPDNVMFSIICEEPVVVDQIMLIINKQLLMPRKKKSVITRFFSSLGKSLSKVFKCTNY
ncbi:hypothetical protein D4764_15G0004110 [Takifugu flavidus]|uniref:Uncharacterized protein n=1 Tax=Takifugu flavidus TaxID=433684 RepID=A0A5C6P4G5_9TELE|nr:hypothetical protein D4764_15G0004110 [Takifugu flavidus]